MVNPLKGRIVASLYTLQYANERWPRCILKSLLRRRSQSSGHDVRGTRRPFIWSKIRREWEKREKEKKEVAIPAAPTASVNYIKSTDEIAQQRKCRSSWDARILLFQRTPNVASKPLKLDFLQKYSIHCIRKGSSETPNHNAFREKTRDRYSSIIRRYFQAQAFSLVQRCKSALSFFRTLGGQIWLLRTIDSSSRMRVYE